LPHKPACRQVQAQRIKGIQTMKHIIMGTAGHVDHGKTALVKALTNIDCDTHPEEKKRGITINLGFSHLDLASGGSIGIVDVPGHKDFVHTMVGGASGIDFVCLVIAADSGVMPQTREHLQILDILGTKTGLVALTKIDLVDSEILELAKEEVKEFVAGTCLDNCPIVGVSSVTGQGLDELKQEIAKIGEKISQRAAGKVFRLFVDRIFTVSGFGTVVTGSVLSGQLSKDQKAYLLPGVNDELRARRLERHGQETNSVNAGDRASINLLGLSKESFKRGMVVSDRQLKETQMIDVRLKLFPNCAKFNLWAQVVFHVGTYERQAKVHLIDKDVALGGEEMLAQIHLSAPAVLMHGDKFVIRNSSSDITLGGGEIIDAAPLHHRRRPEKMVREIKNIAGGELAQLIFAEARKRYTAVSSTDIADILNVSDGEVLAVIKQGVPQDVFAYVLDDQAILIVNAKHDQFAKSVLAVIKGFHRRNPLSNNGISKAELIASLGVGEGTCGEKLLEYVLADLKKQGLIEQREKNWAISGQKVELGQKLERDISLVENYFKGCGMQVPLKSELENLARKNQISDKDIKQILYYLIKEGRAYKINDEYVHASIVDSCRNKLLQKLAQTKQGLKVSDFRDLVSGNRKICLLLLAQYDNEGVTKRNGDFRVITEAGLKSLESSSL
jgi:selenocysteine-specific elongation factor